MTEPVISLKDVHLTLGSAAAKVHILKGISLDLASGDSVGIVGPSGSGKSTLLMILGGLEKADSGSVSVAGQNLTEMNEDKLARFRGNAVGIIFQSFHLVPTMSALENVAVPLELAGRKDAFARAAEELGAVGLSERHNHFPSELSGGEQQRVAIARALAPEPAILIADEPTGNLDETTGTQIVDLLFSSVSARSTTLVLVTHDNQLANKCNRVVEMRSGEIANIQTPNPMVA